MALGLDRDRLDGLLGQLAARLDGDWLLLGGALVALWAEPRRVTEDIDIISVRGHASDRLALMQAALDLGLPVEAVNSAADFFVHRIGDWRAHLVPWRRGTRATIFRPTPTLFVLLKAQRLTALDLDDCLAVLAKSRAEGLPVDFARLRDAVAGLEPSADVALALRRARLAEALAGG